MADYYLWYFRGKNGNEDVARVRDLPYAEADKLAKMVLDDLNISLDDAIEKSPEFKRSMRIIRLRNKLSIPVVY